jgi:hypothetical protein
MPDSRLKDRVAALEADMVLMKEELDRAHALAGIERGIRAMHRGDGVPAREGMEKLRRKHKIPAR